MNINIITTLRCQRRGFQNPPGQDIQCVGTVGGAVYVQCKLSKYS